MKRLILLLAFALTVPATLVFAQEGEKKEAHGAQAPAEEEGGLEIWKWANFLVLAGGLGYLIGKNAGPFFATRSATIRKDLEESLRQSKDAEARVAETNRRLATLESEIAAVRAESDRDLQLGTERLARQTAEEFARIQAHAEQEIAIAGKDAHMQLKRYSAELAIGLAEQKVRARMNTATDEALVEGFVRDLK
jgi:F0F1-type ATP synthase membrane subunit b/b'